MARIKGITIEIGAEAKGLEKVLEDVNKQSKEINRELREVNKLLKFDPKNTELLSQKQKLLGDQITATKEKLDRLKAAQEQVNEQFKKGEISEEQYRAFKREIEETAAKLKYYEEQLKQVNEQKNTFAQRMEEASKKLKDVGEKMTDVGQSLSKKVTAPIVGLGTVATKSAIDFESAFAGVRKTVDATEEEFSRLEKGIRNMAKEIPASATEIAAVAEAAGQLGIKTENILEFTRVMIDMGVATNLSAEEAASSLARFANITQMSQKDFDRLGSTIVKLGNNFATTETEIVNMGLRLAGAGSQIGLTEAQIMSFAAALSSVGIEAEAGGSAFSKVMVNMQLAVETNSEKLQEFASVAGMSAEEFKKAFEENAAGAILAFIQGLGNAEERGMSAIKILDDMGISEVRLRDALLRAAGASDVFKEALNLGTQAWEENNALTKEAEQRYQTTESQIQIAKNTLQDAGITIGEIVMPHVLDLVEGIKELADKFSKLSPQTQENIVKIGLLAAAIGPLLVVVGTLFKSIGNIIDVGNKLITNWDNIKKVGGILSSGLQSTVGFIFSPTGAIIAGIAAAIAIGVALYKNWDTIKAKASELSSAVKVKFEEIRGNISEKMNSAKEAVKTAIDKMRSFFDFKWELPKLKLPRISVQGKFSLNPPQVPKFNIEWRKEGAIFTKPYIFGNQGVGEAGPEAVLPIEKLGGILADTLERMGIVNNNGNIIIQNMQVRDETDIKLIARELYNLQRGKLRAKGVMV